MVCRMAPSHHPGDDRNEGRNPDSIRLLSDPVCELPGAEPPLEPPEPLGADAQLPVECPEVLGNGGERVRLPGRLRRLLEAFGIERARP